MINKVKKYIYDIEDEDAISYFFFCLDEKKILNIILNTHGTYSHVAEKIVYSIKKRSGKTKVFVLLNAESGGTVISLVADDLYMHSLANLGPIDTQYKIDEAEESFSMCTLIDCFKNSEPTDDITKMRLHEAKITYLADIKLLNDIASYTKMDNVTKKNLKRNLLDQKYLHEKPFFVEDCANLGLKIKRDIPTQISDIFMSFMRFSETFINED